MAKKYALNYDWSKLGPTQWSDFSVVTLQADFHSYDDGEALWDAISQWWQDMPKYVDEDLFPDGDELAYNGGCGFPAPVRVNNEHVTCWLVSHGQDAFDSIAHYAEELRRVAENADPEVEAVWTELPHR